MALKPGIRFGPYEITAPLGAGRVGEDSFSVVNLVLAKRSRL